MSAESSKREASFDEEDDAMSRSSADEAWHTKVARKESRTKAKRYKPIERKEIEDQLPDTTGQQMDSFEPPESTQPILEIRTFQQLAQDNKDFVHQDPVYSEQQRKAGFSLPPMEKPDNIDRDHEVEILKDMLSKMALPRFVDEVTEETIKTADLLFALRKRRVRLPVFTVDYCNFLNGESGMFQVRTSTGSYVWRNFPPCKRGYECVYTSERVLIPGLETRPAIGTAIMFEEEKELWDSRGECPREQRLCLGCHNFLASRIDLLLRANSNSITLNRSCVIQCFRNLMNEEGGYNESEFIQPGDIFTGHFDPILYFSCSTIVVTPMEAQGGRRVFLEPSRVFIQLTKEPLTKPGVGESHHHFLMRSKLGSTYDRERVERLRFMDPRRSLLRQYPDECAAVASKPLKADPALTFEEEPKGFNFKSLLATIEQWNSRPLQDFEEWVTRDSLISCFMKNFALAQDVDSARGMAILDEVPCELSILQCTESVLRCCFRRTSRPDKDELVHLISKGLPQRCQTRKFPDMFQRDMIHGEPTHRKVFMLWYYTAILGNFKRSTKQLPISSRLYFYFLFHHQQKALEKYLLRNPMQMLWVLRLYVIYIIESVPAAVSVISTMFHWQRFVEVTLSTISTIQDHFHKDLTQGRIGRHSLNILRRSPRFKELLTIWTKADQSISTRITKITLPFEATKRKKFYIQAHKQLGKISCQRARRPLVVEFHTLTPKAIVNENYLGKYTPEDYKLLWDWITRLDPDAMDLVKDVFPHCGAFGVTREGKEKLISMNNLYTKDQAGKKMMKTSVNFLYLNYPAAYKFMNEFCKYWNFFASVRFYELPMHYLEAQLTAVHSRYNIPQTQIPLEANLLYFCYICRTVYSVVHRYSDPCKAHARANCRDCNPVYGIGYAGMVRDYNRNEHFCREEHEIFVPRLRKLQEDRDLKESVNTKATSVVILGRAISINGKFYTLCSTTGCGKPMEFNAAYCVYIGGVYVCPSCSEKILNKRDPNRYFGKDSGTKPLKKRRLTPEEKKELEAQNTRCLVCDKKLDKVAATKKYHYPLDTFLCDKHHSERVQRRVLRYMLNRPGPLESEVELFNVIIEKDKRAKKKRKI